MSVSANVFAMLESLGENWDVQLTSHEVGPAGPVLWRLTIVGPVLERSSGTMSMYRYQGTLAGVVARAHAGEPSDY